MSELIELDLSDCTNLNGDCRDWDLRSAKRVGLGGLTWINDGILNGIKWPPNLEELSLERTSVTLKGVIDLLKKCEVKKLTFPSNS